MSNSKQWKKLVTRESTFLERTLRFEGYAKMLPLPFTVKQKDLLAVYSRNMTTQYIKADDYTSKIKSIKKDLNDIGFEKTVNQMKDILKNLEKSVKQLLKKKSFNAWKNFEKYYELSRAIILYSSNLAIFLKESQAKEKKVEILQSLYDKAEERSSLAWKNLFVFFKYISKLKKVDVKKLSLYTNEEFSELLLNDSLIKDGLLIKRENFTLMKLENYKSELLFGKSAKIKFNQIKFEKENTGKKIKGSVAYKGNVCGVARLVLTKSDYIKINKGDILVTYMTHPNMISIISKVAGIITDEGGVLCHAAITARESGIPCVIGTKIATKVLKDGDLVEVDADKGVVKIIKK